MIMKRNIYLLFALWVFSANVGCTTNFDEINRNPNEMDEGAISPTGMLQETLLHRRRSTSLPYVAA